MGAGPRGSVIARTLRDAESVRSYEIGSELSQRRLYDLGLLIGSAGAGLLMWLFPESSRITSYLEIKAEDASSPFEDNKRIVSPLEVTADHVIIAVGAISGHANEDEGPPVNLADRLRGVLRTGHPVSGLPVHISRETGARSGSQGLPGLPVLEDVLGGKWCEAGDARSFVVERRVAGDEAYGHLQVGDCARWLHRAERPASLLLCQSVARMPFVFFDLETTGTDTRTGRILEIGAARSGWLPQPFDRCLGF
jgi:hypothetical protein